MTEAHGAPKARILLIEDNPADAELVRIALKNAELDCELTVMADGAEALAFIRGRPENAAAMPDVAVLDLNLPRNSGLEVLEAICASRACDGIQVVILSSSPSPREQTRIKELRVARYLTKPFDLEEFLRIGLILKELLEERSSGTPSP